MKIISKIALLSLMVSAPIHLMATNCNTVYEKMSSGECDWDEDGILNKNDVDDDNDGILDAIECKVNSAANGDFEDEPQEDEAEKKYTLHLGENTITYTAVNGKIKPYNWTVDNDNPNEEFFAYKTKAVSMEPQKDSTMRVDFSKPYTGEFAIVDIDQNGESATIRLYDENGTIIPNPGQYVKTSGEGTEGTYPNGKSKIYTDLGEDLGITKNNNNVKISLKSNPKSDQFDRKHMLFFNLGDKKLSRVEMDNDGSSGTSGFLFSKVQMMTDSDGDGIPNCKDLDSDNDGIYDIVEAGNIAKDTDHDGKTNGDVGDNGLDNSLENDDTKDAKMNYTLPNTDKTGRPDYVDIDADDDGIVDNIEGQTTLNYTAPIGTDEDKNGVDDAYDTNGDWINPTDTDKDDKPDYVDLDSDNSEENDTIEGWDKNNDGIADITPSGTDVDNDGLDDAYDNDDNKTNPTNATTPSSYPNNDTPTTPERDWRESMHPPVATDDNKSGEVGQPVEIDVLANDSDVDNDIDPTTVKIKDANGKPVTTLTVKGEGKWEVEKDGKIKFTPETGFAGDPTPINYTVKDKTNKESNPAKVTIDYAQKTVPDAKDDEKTGVVGESVTIDILANDNSNLKPETVNLEPDSVNGVGEDTDGDGDIDKVVVKGEGVWSVDNNGILTFTPESGFTSNPTPIKYSAKDANGNKSEAYVAVKYATASTIHGFIWYDENVDGLMKDEVKVVDVEVKLYDEDGELVNTTKTDKNGSYSFSNVQMGKKYTVKFAVPDTYLTTLSGKDSDTNAQGIATITPTADADNSVDMGIICECDDYKIHPENKKSVSASALNIFGLAIMSLILVGFARREER